MKNTTIGTVTNYAGMDFDYDDPIIVKIYMILKDGSLITRECRDMDCTIKVLSNGYAAISIAGIIYMVDKYLVE